MTHPANLQQLLADREADLTGAEHRVLRAEGELLQARAERGSIRRAINKLRAQMGLPKA